MKYYNLVFIKHENDYRNYLFCVPMGITLKAGQKVFVNTMHGEAMGDCVTDSFIVDEYTTKQIIAGAGAYEPLKEVIGIAKEQSGYRCMYFGIPF